MNFYRFQATKQTGILISNNASKCYYQIVHSIAMIAIQHVGIPYNTTKSLFLPLQKMTHNISTGFGTSDVTYSADNKNTSLQGILQGNGNGPSTWTILSSIIFQLMKAKGFGTEFTSMITESITKFVGYGFVDNVDLVLMADTKIFSTKHK